MLLRGAASSMMSSLYTIVVSRLDEMSAAMPATTPMKDVNKTQLCTSLKTQHLHMPLVNSLS